MNVVAHIMGSIDWRVEFLLFARTVEYDGAIDEGDDETETRVLLTERILFYNAKVLTIKQRQ